jgi:hypothetical protein
VKLEAGRPSRRLACNSSLVARDIRVPLITPDSSLLVVNPLVFLMSMEIKI